MSDSFSAAAADTARRALMTFDQARAELERLLGQQEGIERVIGPTSRGEALRVVLSAYDDRVAEIQSLREAHEQRNQTRKEP